MIAYRAETAMASVVREAMARGDDARSLLRTYFARRPTCFPTWSSRSCESTFTPCQIHDPIERLHTCSSISTMPSSLIQARIFGSCTQSWGPLILPIR